jgi:hypothetical protein
MVFRVNGGIVNQQTLTGGMRFFKIVGPFAWAVSDGTVNLPVSVSGGQVTATSYFVVGNGKPVPNSAAEKALEVVTRQTDIIIVGFVPGVDGASTQMDIAVSASAFGWGSDVPAYSVPPADADEEQLPTSPTAAAAQIQAAIRALPDATVYITTGGAVNDTSEPPVSATVSFSAVTVTEVSFALGNLTYYNLA